MMLVPASAAGADITASLSVPDSADWGRPPYAAAELALSNPGSSAIDAVTIRPTGGGPAVRYSFAGAPGQTGWLRVVLPALWPVQQYRVAALAADGEPAGHALADVSWPADRVATDAFIDDAYTPWRDVRAGWSMRTRAAAVGLLGLVVIAAAGLLWIPAGWGRVLAVVGLAAGATVLLAAAGRRVRPVEISRHTLVRYADRAPVVESFSVLAARRAGPVVLQAGDVPYPVYPDRTAAGRDNSTVDPIARTIELNLQAGQVLDPAINTALQDAKELQEQLATGIERFFQFTFYIKIPASTLEELDSVTKQVEAIA
ncbi:hypothetical protein LCGC14_1848580, partial [marine sediment metagenome]